MKTLLSLAALALVVAAINPTAAEAYPYGYYGNWHHGYYRGYNGFDVVVAPVPYYYPTTQYVPVAPYAPPPVYAAPAPAPVYSAPQNTANGYCREFTRNVMISGHMQQAYGTACQQPDGSWQTVN